MVEMQLLEKGYDRPQPITKLKEIFDETSKKYMKHYETTVPEVLIKDFVGISNQSFQILKRSCHNFELFKEPHLNQVLPK